MIKQYVVNVGHFLADKSISDVLINQMLIVVKKDEQLSNYMDRLRAHLDVLRPELMMVVETEYVDAVFRDTYYNYFSTKLKPYYRNCVRLSFFEPGFKTINEFCQLPEEEVQRLYLGFLVLRPIGKCIGRNIISPKAKKAPYSSVKLTLAEFHSTCLGVKLTVEAFPHASQDGEYMTCAETTTWNLMEYFGNKYALYKPLLPSELINNLHAYSTQRMVPSSGLTIQQISMAIEQQGFSSLLYTNKDKRFKELFTCYVESGLPLAVAISSNVGGHAVVCVGREEVDKGKMNKGRLFGSNGYIVWNYNVDNFVFNDDNRPSYMIDDFTKPTQYLPNAAIQAFIVPLHKKIYLPAEQAIDTSHFFIEKEFHFPTGSAVRTFLTSCRSYREYIRRNLDFTDALKIAYLKLEMPKFIWVTEVSTNADFLHNKVNSLIILDATSPSLSSNPYASLILKQNNNVLTIYDENTRSFNDVTMKLPVKFESFNHNLR